MFSDGTRQPPTQRLPADAECIGAAAALLNAGQLVAIPTETVYGLAADATNPEAVAAIYAAKGRPRFNPLIAHIADEASARREGVFDANAAKLAVAFWPGPLTLVVPASPDGTVCALARAGLPSVALRVPGHPTARELIARLGRPVAAPSANRSGRVSPTRAEHVLAELDGRIAALLDGGPCSVGVESTVVACLDGRVRLLRPGGVTRAELTAVLDCEPQDEQAQAQPIGPGLLASHYAPRAQVRLEADRIRTGEAALLFGPRMPEGVAETAAVASLSERGDLHEAASRLFDLLRQLDASGAGTIAVVPIPADGLGEAINDRLRRAAAPR